MKRISLRGRLKNTMTIQMEACTTVQPIHLQPPKPGGCKDPGPQPEEHA